VVQDGGFDLSGDAVGLGALGVGQPVDQSFGATGVEVAPNLGKPPARIAHDLAGLADVG